MLIIIYILVGIVFGLLGNFTLKGFAFNFLLWPLIAGFLISLVATGILALILTTLSKALGLEFATGIEDCKECKEEVKDGEDRLS